MNKKVPVVREGGRVPVSVLKLHPDFVSKIKEMAENMGVPVAVYLRMVIMQHTRTPLIIDGMTHTPPPKAPAATIAS